VEPLSSSLQVGVSLDKSSDLESPFPVSSRGANHNQKKNHVKMHKAKSVVKKNSKSKIITDYNM
jgi:hypothetical protein